MHFCSNCKNMLYIRLKDDESNNLIYYCRNCGETGDSITQESVCVLNTDIINNEKAYLQDINEYTKLDPTLPRTQNIKCPNQSCPSNSLTEEENKNEVIYLRYDDINLKYVYICTKCDTIWKTSD